MEKALEKASEKEPLLGPQLLGERDDAGVIRCRKRAEGLSAGTLLLELMSTEAKTLQRIGCLPVMLMQTIIGQMQWQKRLRPQMLQASV